jgi:hypothetical protein
MLKNYFERQNQRHENRQNALVIAFLLAVGAAEVAAIVSHHFQYPQNAQAVKAYDKQAEQDRLVLPSSRQP